MKAENTEGGQEHVHATVSVLSGVVEEEEDDVEKVCDGAMVAVAVVEGTVSLVEERGENGPDAGWQQVCAGVCADLLSQTKVYAAQVVQSGV